MNRHAGGLVLLAGFALAGWACGPNANTSRPAGVEEAAYAPEESEGPPLFEDITARSGMKITYRNGEEADHLSIFESVGGGVGVLDFDGDGLPDLFIPGGGGFSGPGKQEVVGLPCKLFRNMGGCRFEDVTAEVGLDRLAGKKPWFYTHGVAVADFDRDGRPDLLVLGWGRIALFRNVDGKGFEDVSEKAGLATGVTWAVSAAWADFDGDGWPDLYVCQYVDWSMQKNPTCVYNGKRDICTPKNFNGLTHKVYRNNGDGTFTDVSATCGLVKGGPESSKGLGVLAVDVDGDGKPDLYVCNDGVDKFLYLNKSTKGKILFEERGLECGVAHDDQGGMNGSMGVDAGDYDGSGKPSLWVTNFENELHSLYKNTSRKGHVSFRFQTREAGIAAVGQPYVGWGTSFIDFDLNGWEDLFVSNGHAIRYPETETRSPRQRPVLFLNTGKGKFLPANKRLGSYGQEAHRGRGAGFVDLDNDGRVDIVLNHMNEPAAVLRNIASEDNHWLGVQLTGANNADVVGARVVLAVGGRKQTRFAKGGGSFASSSDRRLVFGLGKADRIEKLEVTWPDGKKQEWTGLGIDRYHVLSQGAKEAREYPAKRTPLPTPLPRP
jgi:enediyne biosynthesis protein E4